MKTSVVILNWNGKNLLEEFLGNVIDNTLVDKDESIEIVVADNGSEDGSLEYLKQNYHDKIRTIDLRCNHGFAEGYNLALSQVDAEYAVLLNSDVKVTQNWLNIMTDYMDENPDVSACQPKILSLVKNNMFEHAGAAGGFIDKLGYPFCRGRIINSVEEDKGQYEDIADVFWATGACLCVRLDDYWEAGGLDARFFAHMEEIDLCWRLRSRSKRIVCIPQSVVYHLGGATLKKNNPQKTFLNYRNNLLMLYKNLPSNKFWYIFIIRSLMDYLSIIFLLFKGNHGDVAAVFRARRSFNKAFPKFRGQRKKNLNSATLVNIPEIYNGSIILGYYLFGRRKYSDYSRRKY